MIYYCIYKDECSYKECMYRKTKSKFSSGNDSRNLATAGFDCIVMNNKTMRLISDERIICDRYKECTINCFLKTSYITTDTFEDHFGYKLDLSKPFHCYDAKLTVYLRIGGESVGNYTSIWD